MINEAVADVAADTNGADKVDNVIGADTDPDEAIANDDPTIRQS